MKGYASHGFKDFVLCLGYKGWLLKEFFMNYRAMSADVVVHLDAPGRIEFLGARTEDWKVTLVDTGEETMTGGRLLAVRRYLEGDPTFLLTYGDGVSDVNVRALVDFHREQGKVATVTAVRPPGRFGEIQIDGHEVLEFNEKPQATAGFINGGFFVLDNRRVWDYFGDAGPGTVLEREPLQRLAQDRQLAAFEHTGFWQPMDTLREYTLLNGLWSGGQAPWKTWTDEVP
jgi:glucose-1-phosphate cytidylyltransferase